jgi:hypothetical protein
MDFNVALRRFTQWFSNFLEDNATEIDLELETTIIDLYEDLEETGTIPEVIPQVAEELGLSIEIVASVITKYLLSAVHALIDVVDNEG